MVPVYHFGNAAAFDLIAPPGTARLARALRVAPILPAGVWGLPVPHPVGLLVAVGEPVRGVGWAGGGRRGRVGWRCARPPEARPPPRSPPTPPPPPPPPPSVDQCDSPTPSAVDAAHARFVAALVAVFDAHKGLAGLPPDAALEVV